MDGLVVVGGTFDANGGKPSKIVAALTEALQAKGWNGGSLTELRSFDFKEPSALVWMPNVDNEEEKILATIKAQNPKLLLVSSKRVVEKDYTEGDVIGRLLKSKSNLGIMITRVDLDYVFTLLDPLGNEWARTRDVTMLADALQRRITTLQKLTRVPSRAVGEKRPFTIEPEFIALVRDLGTQFATFVNAVNPNRLLGNAATRCSYGFPAVKEKDRIFVTRRNVEKTTLSAEDFVEVEGGVGGVCYYGEAKPSVDTPIQLRLFDLYPNVRYMVHGHVYIKDAPYTQSKLPCGSVEEAREIQNRFPVRGTANFAVNLRGHGCLMLASNLDYLKTLVLEGRPFPEKF